MATARAKQHKHYQGTTGLSAVSGSYRATNSARSRVRAYAGGGDYHADRHSRKVLRELSQDLERNAECYSIFLSGVPGLIGAPTPRPTSPDESWNEAVSAAWSARARLQRGGFDARGLQSWDDLATSWWRSSLRDGDIAAIPLATGTIATILADQIDSERKPGNRYRRTIGGLTLDDSGQALKVWVAPRDLNGIPQPARAEEFDADDVMLMAWRPDNSFSRGLPIMAAGLDNTERIDSLVEAEVISAEQASNLYGALERQLAAGQVATQVPLSAVNDAGGSTGSPAPAESDTIDYVSFPAGSYLDLPAGLKWTPIAPQRPNLDVPEFLRSLLSISCATVGIPYAVIYCDFKGINWSGNRGLVSLTRDALSRLRSSHCEPFLDPIYPWWLGREITAGRLRPPAGLSIEELTAHAWDWPDRPEWPDPYKEERRHELALSQYTDTLHRIIGPDWHQRITERGNELIAIDATQVQRIKSLTQAIATAGLSDHVTWRDIIALSADRPPQGLSPAAATIDAVATTDEEQ